MHYSIMTTAMTLRHLGCALCMPFISPFRSSFRPYNRAYAYWGLTAFAPLSMALSDDSAVSFFSNYSDEHPITVSPGANQRGEALLSPLPTLK
ncbi:MAG: hypothetical protein KZQ60_02550, partial [Candidatus Thiodiazotropha sp. (ex Lucinoma aequizonata)]|nr:hypothetical protein [Candidatus Thiodiazotropha sp. (ex Lucinoma aequizonata)]